MALTLLQDLGADPARVRSVRRETHGGARAYAADEKRLMKDAAAKEKETENEERRALRFDIGEGLLELGLVLCSLYFLARKAFFPVLGVLASVAGTILGVLGFLL